MRRIIEAIQNALNGLLEAAQWTLFLPFRLLRAGFTPPAAQGAGKQTEQAAAEAQQAVNEKASQVSRLTDIQRSVSLLQRAASWKSRGRDFRQTFGEFMTPEQISWVQALTVSECETLARTDSRLVCAYVTGQATNIPGVRLPAEITMAAKRKPAAQIDEEQAIMDRLARRMAARGSMRHVHDEDCELQIKVPVNAR